jgi:hypothetical protein
MSTPRPGEITDDKTTGAATEDASTQRAAIDPQTLTNQQEDLETARELGSDHDRKENPTARTEDHTIAEDLTASAKGFAPFRLWANQRIRGAAGRVEIVYANIRHDVTEITPDGELRIVAGEHVRLIPFDQRVIEGILEQIL